MPLVTQDRMKRDHDRQSERPTDDGGGIAYGRYDTHVRMDDVIAAAQLPM